MKEKKLASGGIVEFSTIVTLNATNSSVKLIANITEEVRKGGKGVRL